jgi:hypothetical protein
VVIGGWRWLFRCWGDSCDGTCCSRAASSGGVDSSSVEGSVGASCFCLFVYSLVVCVFHSVFVMHKYLLDLFVEWSFKGVHVIFVYCLDNCFVKFVSDFGCRGVLYPSFCLCDASWLLAMEGAHASLLKINYVLNSILVL